MSFLRSAGALQRTAQASIRPKASAIQQSFLSRSALFHTSIARLALSSDARKKIDEAVNSHDVVVFMKGTPDLPMCGFSRGCAQLINEIYQVPKTKLKTFNVLDDQELREGIKEYSSWPTIPQVYLKGDFLGGFDIMLSMHQSGELEELLVNAGVVPKPEPEAPKA
ncbi:hypothetical protein CBS101457_000666 [Exobasidium rhododendri]|nr:hypothetical protein CBS101457_000666 [Exobasidium rhododendri]